MNQSPAWFAQRYPPGGAVAGDGIQKQLGTPQLDPLEVLVREAAQNSWDAKLSAERSISFCLFNGINACLKILRQTLPNLKSMLLS